MDSSVFLSPTLQLFVTFAQMSSTAAQHSTSTNGKTFKEFLAVCPVTRMRQGVFGRHRAAAFLREAVERLDIRAAQVDGGALA